MLILQLICVLLPKVHVPCVNMEAVYQMVCHTLLRDPCKPFAIVGRVFSFLRAGSLLQGLNDDALAVQAGISEKGAHFIQHSSTFIIGWVVAFWRGWDMTLVSCGSPIHRLFMSLRIYLYVMFFLFLFVSLSLGGDAYGAEVLLLKSVTNLLTHYLTQICWCVSVWSGHSVQVGSLIWYWRVENAFACKLIVLGNHRCQIIRSVL